jgi:hypothetical protein
MKNKPDPALSGCSYLFNEIKKRTPKSRETFPLSLEVPFYTQGSASNPSVEGLI